VAAPVLPGRPRRPGRRAAARPAADVPGPGRRRGQGPGLRAARRQREAAGPLDLPRTGHASWLNQVEVYFSVIQRKLLTPDDFGDLDSLADQVLAFEKHYNANARPFDWKFTRAGLNQLLVS